MSASKIRKLYLFLLELSPHLRVKLIQWYYNLFASNNKSKSYIFLNYGYVDEMPLALKKKDEPDRYFIQMYQRAVRNIELQNKDIIEVGCGQGAGGVFLLEYKNLHSYTGIDLSEKAIALCKRNSTFTNAIWLQGRADNLPVSDNSADVIVNIESSHCYPSMDHFLSEVKRVLRPHGYMAYADFRPASKIRILEKNFKTSGLQVLEYEDITPQVLHSLTHVSDRRKTYIAQTYSPIWHKALRDIAAVKGSATYNRFINGELKYLCYLLQKEGSK